MYSCCLSDKAKAINNGCFDETCSTSIMRTFSVGSLTGLRRTLTSLARDSIWRLDDSSDRSEGTPYMQGSSSYKAMIPWNRPRFKHFVIVEPF